MDKSKTGLLVIQTRALRTVDPDESTGLWRRLPSFEPLTFYETHFLYLILSDLRLPCYNSFKRFPQALIPWLVVKAVVTVLLAGLVIAEVRQE